MIRSRHLVSVVSAILVSLGLTACGAATSASRPRHHDAVTTSSVTFVAPVTCTVNGKLAFDPPLTTVGKGASKTTIDARLTKCDNSEQHDVRLHSGRMSGVVGDVSPGSCTTLSSAPPFSNGSITWNPTSQVAASENVSFPRATGSIVIRKGKTFLHLSSSGGSVGSGSFANDGGSSITLTSAQDVNALQGQCSHGLSMAAFTGIVTLTPTPASVTSPVPTAPPGAPAVEWSDMTNGLNIFPWTVACPTTTLCVFAGGTLGTPPEGGTLAISASTGPFTAGATITGHTINFSQVANPSSGTYSGPHLSCPSISLCLLLTPTGVYATTTPLTGPWILELSAPPRDNFSDISCASVHFCAVILQDYPTASAVNQGLTTSNVLISRAPLGGSATWSRTQLTQARDDDGVSSIACPSPDLCVAGGNSGEVGSWMETSSDPTGGPSAWSGGALSVPAAASGPSEYAMGDVGCPTSHFCVGLLDDNQVDASTDPAGGATTWHIIPGRYQSDGVAWCTAQESCAVSDAAMFSSVPDAAGQVVGNSPTLESCVTISFCVSIDDQGTMSHLEVGRVTTQMKPWPPPIARIPQPTAAGEFGTPPPRITDAGGYPPTVLEESDLITGTGPAVKAGDTVTVQYVDADYSTPGTVVQTTWGQMPYSFPVGQGRVIAGWDEGMVGMRVGGRRELIIPPSLAFTGLSDATVIYVIDLIRIG